MPPYGVHVGDSNKLAAHACEGCCLGFDTELCAHCVILGLLVVWQSSTMFISVQPHSSRGSNLPSLALNASSMCHTCNPHNNSSFFLQHPATCYIATTLCCLHPSHNHPHSVLTPCHLLHHLLPLCLTSRNGHCKSASPPQSSETCCMV